MVTDHKPLVWFQSSKDPCSRVTRWKLKLTEYDFDVAYKAGKTNVNADALSRNPIDLEDIENNDINDKNNIEINLIKQGNAKCISRFKHGNKAPEINLKCNEEINYDIIEERKIDESNSKETKEFINGENLVKNKNNRRNYNELKYKVIEDGNNDKIGGKEQILTNDGNLIKNMKDKKYNDDINYEDLKKRRIHENFEELEKLYEEALFKNFDDEKRNYDDDYIGKNNRNDTEKFKQLLNEEYLLKNDYNNDEKCCMKLDFEDIKKRTIYENNEKTIKPLEEENLFNVINKRLIDMNKMKNEGNGNKLISDFGNICFPIFEMCHGFCSNFITK